MSVPDQLRREIVVDAPRAQVWKAITEVVELRQWFSTVEADVDVRPGGAGLFVWEDSRDEAVVETVEPESRFAFRWRPEGSGRPYTLVTFELSDAGEGTRVVLTESGFAALPDQARHHSYEGNDAGWREELEELAAHLAAA
jgi:uncharacterized protein YndB with AHSA1/START domain